MTSLNDFFGGDSDRPLPLDAEGSSVLDADARIAVSDDISAPCYQCFRNDATEFYKSDEHDCIDVRCSRCNVEYRFRMPGLWRLLGL